MIGGLVSVVIAAFDMRIDVDRCLAALEARRDEVDLEVVLVDNASRDGTAAHVRSRYPWVRLLTLEDNIGWTRATNRGIAEAHGPYLLLLNADTVVNAGTLSGLVAFMAQHPEVGIVAPLMRNGDGSVQETARDLPSPLNAVFGRHSVLTRLWPDNPMSRRYLRRDRLGATEPYEVGWVSAAGAMCRSEAMAHIGGGLDESFTHWVDADWCLQIRAAGWTVFCVPALDIVHLEGYGRGYKAPQKIVAFHQGCYALYRKHYVRSPWHPMAWLAVVGLSVRCALLLAANGLKTRGARENWDVTP